MPKMLRMIAIKAMPSRNGHISVTKRRYRKIPCRRYRFLPRRRWTWLAIGFSNDSASHPHHKRIITITLYAARYITLFAVFGKTMEFLNRLRSSAFPTTLFHLHCSCYIVSDCTKCDFQVGSVDQSILRRVSQSDSAQVGSISSASTLAM